MGLEDLRKKVLLEVERGNIGAVSSPTLVWVSGVVPGFIHSPLRSPLCTAADQKSAAVRPPSTVLRICGLNCEDAGVNKISLRGYRLREIDHFLYLLLEVRTKLNCDDAMTVTDTKRFDYVDRLARKVQGKKEIRSLRASYRCTIFADRPPRSAVQKQGGKQSHFDRSVWHSRLWQDYLRICCGRASQSARRCQCWFCSLHSNGWLPSPSGTTRSDA